MTKFKRWIAANESTKENINAESQVATSTMEEIIIIIIIVVVMKMSQKLLAEHIK